MTPKEWFTLVIERGAELRALGVARLNVADDYMTVEFFDTPATPEQVEAAAETMQRELAATLRSPLDDPATYGIQAPNARVPSYRPPEEHDEE